MGNVLKLTNHNSKKEIEFELKFLRSLSVKDRFKLWRNKIRAKFGDTFQGHNEI